MNPGRIHIKFPTKNTDYPEIFDSLLGFSKNGETIPCWFNEKIIPLENKELECILIQSKS